MIQRIQTIWLLLASAAAFATLYFAFYYITAPEVKTFNAKESIFVLVLNVAVAILSLVNIFLFGNRKLQLRFTIVALIVSVLSIVLCFLSVKSSISGGLALTAVVYFIIPVLLFLAARGIIKDEKLVKSVDRLR
ncbi:MAG: DUF4293 domain-containing protein [Chitinophaga sp.]|jgi:drug/metabolite transporter (DMT)-like permease|nr:DUF4293 domain-containing protein [Chitinophaga sp.]